VARVIRATIEGNQAHVGEIAASDVARLILALERALARAAYVALGRERPADTGRHAAAIERATRLRFAGIDRGSFVELLALPDASEPSDDELPITVAALGDAAFEQLLRALQPGAEVDRKLAEAVAELGDLLGVGDRNDRVRLEPDDRRVPPAFIDAGVRSAMRARSQVTPPRDGDADTLVGTLVEADFERRTARLQPAAGKAVTVTFAEEMADSIQTTLRSVATVKGLISYDKQTHAARRVELRNIQRAEQLLLLEGDYGSFDAPVSVEALRLAQGVEVVGSARDLFNDDLTDDDRVQLAALLDG
jgi:hypothetical protein